MTPTHKHLLATILCLLLLGFATSRAQNEERLLQNIAFKTLGVAEKIPVSNITTLHQDGDGFLWIGTDNGFYRYDGYRVKRYKSDPLYPALLTSNHVTAIADHDHVRWIGTRKGLTRINTAGESRHYHFTDFPNSDVVNVVMFTRKGTLWVGTEGGLYRYDAPNDAFTLCCNQRGNSKVPHCSVTSIMEDSRGCLWIGTWDKGLFRYMPTDNGAGKDDELARWYEMPRFNDLNSAQKVFEDSQHRLWVGTWGRGLFCIANPWETGQPLQYRIYNTANTAGALPEDIVWALHEDRYTGLLWIGTRRGLSFISTRPTAGEASKLPTSSMFALPPELEPEPGYFANGASMIFLDKNGRMWLHANRRGIVSTTIRPSLFNTQPLPANVPANDYVSSIDYLPDGHLVVGLAHNGLLTNEGTALRHMPLNISKVFAVVDGGHDSLIVATERMGIVTIHNGSIARQENTANTPWLADNCVYALLNDGKGNLIAGTWKGLSVKYANGKGLHLEGNSIKPLEQAKVKSMAQAPDGSLWLATDGNGVMHLSGSLHNPQSLRLDVFDHLANSPLATLNIFSIRCDREGRIWACSKEAGLMLYSAQEGGFLAMNQPFGIPDDDIYSIEQSADGAFWVASRYSLIRFQLDKDDQARNLRFFMRGDVLGNDFFGLNMSAASTRGLLCFAGHTTLATFRQQVDQLPAASTHPFISDVKILNTSIELLDSLQRQKASGGMLPPYATTITLQPSQRELTLEFASMMPGDNEETRFAYMLEGFDHDWKYTEVGENMATYGNLPAGHYTFRMRCTDRNGLWGTEEATVSIHVLAPVWQRWYARLTYALLLIGLLLLVFRYYQRRSAEQHELQLERMKAQSIEELNHKKLQFFTNITHDLMTPLTIISASSSAIKEQNPQLSADFNVIDNNVNRLMRLLQQILEFRRTETGNLHLRVSQGNLADFVRREVESIRPLTKDKHIDMSLVCSPSDIFGYFDSDKMDKILYNLISNAVKYNRENGFIQVALVCNDGSTAQITVKDNGVGIPAKKLPDLFHRFYEGEHRRFNTYGTGIGLSLTKDLTELHHGTISVESKEGEGTLFTVTIPISASAYQDEEMDSPQPAPTPTGKLRHDTARQGEATVLVVEDNEELLVLLKQLLSSHYHVLTAYNGKEALEVLENEPVSLVLTDVMMPVMDGNELTRQIRENQQLAATPVLMLTAKRDDDDRAEAYRIGADAYITKPFNSAVLLARIQNLIDHKLKADEKLAEQLFAGIKDVKVSHADEDFLKACVACVQRHLADADFSLPAFAEEMNMSTSALYKRLRATTGLTTSAFIRTLRMKSAQRLLQQNPHARISDVAYAVGYTDPKYFSSCFKKDFGVLPSEFLSTQNREE